MVLRKLTLTNFQGIRNLSLDFEGKSASIYGDNGTGKTTVYNALTWLLFDKASTGAKGFSPKTRGKDGELHNLEHSVEGEFDADGRFVVLKKTFKEVYKKKRGSAKEEFTGHSVDYEIDGVPAKEKEFSSRVVEFCGGDMDKIRILTMPDWFPEQMAWEDRRKTLLEMCGNFSEDDVIRSNDELSDLPMVLAMSGGADRRYTVEEYRKIATAKRSEINRQLQEIPARIDEAERVIGDANNVDVSKVEEEIATLNKQYQEALQEKVSVYDAGIEQCKAKIQEIRERQSQARVRYVNANSARIEEIDKKLFDARQTVAKLRVNSMQAEAEAKVLKGQLDSMRALRERLVDEYKAVSQESWDDSNAICPTCGRELPEDKVAFMREEFLLKKSQKLEEINTRGKQEASKEKIAEIEAKLTCLEEAVRASDDAIKLANEAVESLMAEKGKEIPFEKTNENLSYEAEISTVSGEMAEVSKNTEAKTLALDERIKGITERRDALERAKASVAMAVSAKSRIAELEANERSLGAAFEELEHGLYLCDVYTRTMVDMLNDKINSRFKNVRFRLFQEQINGGLKEDCEVMIPSDTGNMVPYAFANNAARLNAGLEIIDTLSKHWGIKMPVVLDNAEAVTHPYKMSGQLIRLVVSDKDKSLRLAVEE